MKKDISVALIAILIVLALAFGLSQMRPDLPLTPSAPYTAATAHVASGAKPAAAKSGRIVMHVNKEPITEAEFMAFLAAIPENQRGVFASAAGKRELANEIVRMKALEQEAHRLGLDNDPEVNTQMDLVRTQVVAQRALQQIVQEAAEKELPAAYEREKKNAPAALRHIVVAYQGGMVPPRAQNQQPPTAEQAIQKANAIVTKLRGGANFAELAKKESDDVESGQRGGSLGPVNPAQLPPEIGTVVSKLKPGQYSDPVRTQFGVHIFNVAEPTLEDLKPMLMQQVQQQIAQETVTRLQKAAEVDLDPQFFPAAPPGPARPATAPPAAPPGRG